MKPLTDQPINILLELVQKHKLDPWDVDIAKLVAIYRHKIDRAKSLDLRVPGRAVLSASVLLRMKSSCAVNGNGKKSLEKEEEELPDIALPDLGELMVPQFMPRKIELGDLLGALKEALAEVPEKKEPPMLKVGTKFWRPDEFEQLLEKESPRILFRIQELLAAKGTVTFVDLFEQPTRESMILTFFVIIFLCAEGKVRLEQPELFGPILVSLPGTG
jgi:chromatin segregation and condensation protein Rec8/ScpA/Scc1 (kleisin family)